MKQIETLKEQLGKPYFDLEFLLNCFKEVLDEIGENKLAECIPWINDDCNLKDLSFSQNHYHMFSVCFQLLNLAETNGAVQNRRKTEEEHSLGAINGLWANTLEILRENGITEQQIAQIFSETE